MNTEKIVHLRTPANEITTGEMVGVCSDWVQNFRNRLGHGLCSNTDLLTEALKRAVRARNVEVTRLAIEAAERGGDFLADDTLRKVFFEMAERGEPMDGQLLEFGRRCALRAPVARGPGFEQHDHFIRDIDLILLIRLVSTAFDIKGRRSGSRRPCGCSIVAAALARYGLKVSEGRLEKLWKSPLGKLVRGLEMHFRVSAS